MQIRQGETQNHQGRGAITNEVCCLAVQSRYTIFLVKFCWNNDIIEYLNFILAPLEDSKNDGYKNVLELVKHKLPKDLTGQ